MGFGLLFIGYILTYLLSLAGGYGCYPAIIGCCVMLYAFTKLVDYEPRFKLAFYAVIPVALFVAYNLSAEITRLFGGILPGFLGNEITATVVAYGKMVADLLFHATLLTAVSKIAGDTGIVKTQKAALRNLIIYALFFIVAVVQSLISDTNISFYVFFAVVILWLAWLVLDCIAIFSCYMRICDESDTEMKVKPSRFSVINRMRDAYDKREEKAIKETRDYRTEKLKRRRDKKQNKSKK